MIQVDFNELIALVGDMAIRNVKGEYLPLNKLIDLIPEHIGRRSEELAAEEWDIVLKQVETEALEAGMVKEYLGPPVVPFQERGEYYCLPHIEPKREIQFVHAGSKDMDAFNLIPDDLPIPKLYGQENTPTDETIIWVKLFSPRNWTWYITEYRPEEKLAFGYVDGFEREWGYISIAEIEGMNAKWRATNNGYDMTFVERDLHFQPMTFSDLKWSVLEKDDE